MKKCTNILLLGCFLFCAYLSFGVGRSWYQKAPIGGDARHRCTGFAIGNKGYIGGGHINSGTSITYKDYWEYDPATNTWSQIADYGGGLRYHSSAFTIGGYAYVGCGENATFEYTNDFWKYVPEVNTWFPIADLPSTPRRGGSAFVIDEIGYFGTGQSDEGYHTDFYSYDPDTDEWTPIADFPGSPRSAAVSFSYGGKGYVGTGHEVGAAVNDFYAYDPVTDTWEEKAPVGGSVRQDAIGFCIDGKGYIGTGNDNIDSDFKDIWEYDFAADTWTQIEDFEGAKRRYGVTFVINNVLYLGSGTDGTNFRDFWAYAPTLSILEEIAETISVNTYPNPSTDLIRLTHNFSPSLTSKLRLEIYALDGKKQLERALVPNENLIYKSDLGVGTYLITIHYENRVIHSKKIMFQ